MIRRWRDLQTSGARRGDRTRCRTICSLFSAQPAPAARTHKSNPDISDHSESTGNTSLTVTGQPQTQQ